MQRKIALEGHRFTPPEALKAGLIDEVVDGKTGTEGVLARAVAMAHEKAGFAKPGSFGLIRVRVLYSCFLTLFLTEIQLQNELWREVVENSKANIVVPDVSMDDAAAKARL